VSDLTISSPGNREPPPEQPVRPAPLPGRGTALDRLEHALTRPPPAPARAPAVAPPSPLPPRPEPVPAFNPATLMGGGWAVTFPARGEATNPARASFHFKTRLVAAVASAAAMGLAMDLPHPSAEGDAALAAYRQTAPAHQSLREGVDAHFQPLAARVDLLD